MVIWFVTLFLTGMFSIIQTPTVFLALSPTYALQFFEHNFFEAFISLSLVILCATGAEALFADMGHLGREPIRYAWFFVCVGIIISYMGQGAFLIRNSGVENPLFEMISQEFGILYIPFLILTICATIIASQAVISGIFSIIYQAITTHLLPMLKVDYTSDELRTQIYIDSVNWMLCCAVIFVLMVFGYSDRIANAYGIAVTGTMMIDAILMVSIYLCRKTPVYIILSLFVLIVDSGFFFSLLTKFSSGGYWSLLIASIPFCIVIIYVKGQEAMYRAIQPMPWEKFQKKYLRAHETQRLIRGTGIFFSRSLDFIPAYIPRTMFINEILYEQNVFVSLSILEKPRGMTFRLERDILPGVSHLSISYGYMQMIDLMKIIRDAGIEEKTIFYGMEEIVSRKLVWKIFYAIKRLCPSFVQYHRLPHNKVHGVVTRIEL
jgi:KUP system potassium uptake protein